MRAEDGVIYRTDNRISDKFPGLLFEGLTSIILRLGEFSVELSRAFIGWQGRLERSRYIKLPIQVSVHQDTKIR